MTPQAEAPTATPTETPAATPTEPAVGNGLATNETAEAGSVVKESEKPSEDDFADDSEELALADMFSTSVGEPKAPVPAAKVGEVEASPQVTAEGSTPPVAAPAATVSTPPPAAAAQQPPPQGVQAQQPAQTPATQQVPSQQAPQTTEEGDGFTQLDTLIEQQRPKVIEALAQQSYQLTEDELNGLQEDPGRTVPKLLARAHVNAVQGVLRHVAQQLPAMMSGMLQLREQNKQREDTFWNAWPQLDRQKHAQQVTQVARVFRQLNPTADMSTFVQHVGAQVMLMNGLHRAAAPVQPQVAQPRPAPFVPAGAGHGGVPNPAAMKQPEGWEVIASMMQQED